MNIRWHKKDEKAIIPTKRNEDAGFDIYTIENNVILMPHEKHLFKTGLQYWITPGYWLLAFDRGSTGSKGMHVHCGICDNGYRGEIFICINNDNDYPVYITDSVEKPEFKNLMLYYPKTKALAQLIPMKAYEVVSDEVSDEDWADLAEDSERKDSALGASGK